MKSILKHKRLISCFLACVLIVGQIMPTPFSLIHKYIIPGFSNTASSASPSSVTSGDPYGIVDTGSKVSIKGEMKAIWISYLSFPDSKYSEKKLKRYIDKMYNTCKTQGYNTVIFHVRPFSDAIYPSKYYPWSKYFSGKAGKDPGYDPLAYAVKAAHQNGLAFHAWINPYRVTLGSTKLSKLPKDSLIYQWAKSSDAQTRRNVLKYNGNLYLNPASKQVRTLVTNGVKEIVTRYNVDGIHFDDYFYPNLGTKYKSNFDAKEYKAYVKECKQKRKKALNIISWRRQNVNTLLSRVHKAIRKIDKKCVFGVSPAGNIGNLYANNNYYADVKKWMRSTKYVDYIAPQIYWSFSQKSSPFKKTVKRWISLKKTSKVKLYIGIAGYRAGISLAEAKSLGDTSWAKTNTMLKRQVKYIRKYKKCNGFIVFSYQDLKRKTAAKEMKNLSLIMK